MSDRTVDFSLDKNQPAFNSEQARMVAQQIGLENPLPVNVEQVHANTVLVVKEEAQPLEKADGLVTDLKNVPLVIRTADCLPIFLYDRRLDVIGLVHAGWRGTRERIVVKAIEQMQQAYGSKIKDLNIAFGPAIQSCCYKVGEEFAQFFPEEIIKKKDQFYLDLVQANRNQLYQLHLEENQLHDCKICTCCNEELFSYRREGKKAGRMISLMVLKDEGV